MERNFFLRALPYKTFCFDERHSLLKVEATELVVESYQLWKESCLSNTKDSHTV